MNSAQTEKTVLDCIMYTLFIVLVYLRLILIEYCENIVSLIYYHFRRFYFLPETSILNGLQANFCLNCTPSVPHVTFCASYAPTVLQWCTKCLVSQNCASSHFCLDWAQLCPSCTRIVFAPSVPQIIFCPKSPNFAPGISILCPHCSQLDYQLAKYYV